ncbi:MAG TPA: FGGY-family carbohydrate kinase [Candidatus Pullichristensenella excrementigallinarum]|uniref:FGGY-family carbohydrate kinase n=1 Tax=Candidatus Pullichristensenella excrementigallinarum TaxID=2840907 RepID=A0A9D1IDH7_9FIRM|nr:FGGY-family carbohydrate kinase [Candidatus Pullichristensenella excrementigallinarum]
MGNYLVGCDIGTSGTKSVVMREDGCILGSAYIEYPLITPRPGWAEHEPDWYWNAVADTMRDSIAQAGIDAGEIRGVSISAFSPACILVDRDLRPLQNSHIWMDRRATRQADWVREHIGEQRASEKCANPIDPYYASIKLMWERDNRPELYQKTYKILTAADYATMRLTGKAVTDYSNACLFGAGFDIVRRAWDTELIEQMGLDPEKYPDIYPCDEVIGEVTQEAAERTGLKKGTPVVAGTVDCNAAYVANGAIHSGDISIAMGTAGCIGYLHKEPRFSKNMITLIHTSDCREMYCTLGATVSCGALTRYFRDTFAQVEKHTAGMLGMDAYEIMNLEAEKVPVGSDGLIVLPYFMGERTPFWNPLARGVLFGLSLAHTRGHIYRAFIEGATYALYQNFRQMRSSGAKLNFPMILVEGGAKSALWRQIVSDVFDIPVAYMEESKGAPVGNAVLAGVGVGLYPDFSVVEDWVQFSDHHEPNPQAHEEYMKYYEIFCRLYGEVEGEYKELAKATGYC